MRDWMKAGLFGFGVLASAGFAQADDQPRVLVELFTSQGCNSCPPADALLAELATRDDVLPLALHVDYWDYIGWADSFARPEHTTRQKAYAHEAGLASIFTPQMVIGGVDHVIGFKPMKVADLMRAHEEQLGRVDVVVEKEGNGFRIECTAKDGAMLPKKIFIDLVRFEPSSKVEIKHGENAGETITYANIVRSWDRIATWDGKSDIVIDAPTDTDGPFALILQEAGPGTVLAAYQLD